MTNSETNTIILAGDCYPSLTCDPESLREAAVAFRSAIEHCKDRLGFPEMKRFPVGCCKIASMLLGRYLVHELGFRPMSFISGEHHDRQPRPFTHIWLEYSRTLVDITADQFSGMVEQVVVTDDRSWHDKTFPEQKRFEFETEGRRYDDSFLAKLDSDFSMISHVLSCSTTDPSCPPR
jgi:hypothetical protein